MHASRLLRASRHVAQAQCRVAHRASWTSLVRLSVRHSSTSIETLRERFKDPTSPFHLPPGTLGPDSPDPPLEELSPAEEGAAHLQQLGYHPESFWEQHIVWGDHDAFQHVNNVRYVRFFESGRIHWMRAIGHELGGPAQADAMIRGRGISLILKSLSINWKYPVVYPDTLLVAHRPHPGPRQSKTHFGLQGAIWSYAQRRVVTECDSVIVWYDYDNLRKCEPGEVAAAAIQKRMEMGLRQ